MKKGQKMGKSDNNLVLEIIQATPRLNQKEGSNGITIKVVCRRIF